MKLCVKCNERKHSKHFKIKINLLKEMVYFKVCEDCGDESMLSNSSWKNFMIDKGALSDSFPTSPVIYRGHEKYNIPGGFNKIYESQNGRCKTCETHQCDLSKILYVDHDHKTGAVRGLLCGSCNSCLGFSKDSIKTLKNMITYLNKNSQGKKEFDNKIKLSENDILEIEETMNLNRK